MSSTELRQSVIRQAQRVVVKLGTQLLTDEQGRLDAGCLSGIAAQVAELRRRGIDVTIVSSGSVGVGCKTLGLTERPTDVGAIQAVAAVGQSGLMSRWYDAFKAHDIRVAQMLVTRNDFEDRQRYLNIRNCIGELHEYGAVPIINENDTVSVEEIRFGDNDILAALVTNSLRADLLVLLSVVDGLLDEGGNKLDIVHDVLDARALVLREKSDLGTGGMESKLEAARLVTDAGEVAVIANGRADQILTRLLDAEQVGTVFVPANRKLDSKSRWIGMTVRPTGTLTVDDGAVDALTQNGTSLLAIGITDITGRFEKGDVAVVRDGRGREVARGLINYDSRECRLIMGKRTEQFESLLGRKAYDEVIHRDNMVLTPLR